MLTDPGGITGIGMTAAWVLPMVVLGGLALLPPETGAPVLSSATVLVLGFTVVDAVVGVVPRDDVGPVAAITVFALAVALAGLGAFVHGVGDGPGSGALLGSSSGVVVVPVLLAGTMLWLAGLYADEHVRPVWPQAHPVG